MVEQGDLPCEERGGVCDPQACLWPEEGSLSVVYVGLVSKNAFFQACFDYAPCPVDVCDDVRITLSRL